MNLAVVSRKCATFGARPSTLPLCESRREEAPTSNEGSIFASPPGRKPRTRREAPRLTQRLAASSRSLPLSPNLTQPSRRNLVHVDGRLSKKKVSFSSINIREYDRAIGTHTDIDGLPLTIDWGYDEKEFIAIDDYENTRSPRKPVKSLLLSASDRRLILMRDCGMSTEVLNAVEQRLMMERRLGMLQAQSERRRVLRGCLGDRPHLLKYI